MRIFIFSFLFVLFISPGYSAFAADQSWCKANVTPAVSVNVTTKPINWVFTHTADSLTREMSATNPGYVSPYGANAKTFVEGLASGSLAMTGRVQRDYVLSPDKRTACIFYKSVNVEIAAAPTVYVASNYRPGTCMHKAVKEHEIGHVNIDRTIANQYAQAIGAAIQQEISQQNIYGPITGAQAQQTLSQMNGRMELLLKAYNETMIQDQRKRQQAHDTLQEYQRVAAECAGHEQSY